MLAFLCYVIYSLSYYAKYVYELDWIKYALNDTIIKSVKRGAALCI
mgnify:FL=1